MAKQRWVAAGTHDQLVCLRVFLAHVVLLSLVRHLHSLPDRIEQNPVMLSNLSPIDRSDDPRRRR